MTSAHPDNASTSDLLETRSEKRVCGVSPCCASMASDHSGDVSTLEQLETCVPNNIVPVSDLQRGHRYKILSFEYYNTRHGRQGLLELPDVRIFLTPRITKVFADNISMDIGTRNVTLEVIDRAGRTPSILFEGR